MLGCLATKRSLQTKVFYKKNGDTFRQKSKGQLEFILEKKPLRMCPKLVGQCRNIRLSQLL